MAGCHIVSRILSGNICSENVYSLSDDFGSFDFLLFFFKIFSSSDHRDISNRGLFNSFRTSVVGVSPNLYDVSNL